MEDCDIKDNMNQYRIYLMTIDNQYRYVGRTGGSIAGRLANHCSKYSNPIKNLQAHLDKAEHITIETIATASNQQRAVELEREHIVSYYKQNPGNLLNVFITDSDGSSITIANYLNPGKLQCNICEGLLEVSHYYKKRENNPPYFRECKDCLCLKQMFYKNYRTQLKDVKQIIKDLVIHTRLEGHTGAELLAQLKERGKTYTLSQCSFLR